MRVARHFFCQVLISCLLAACGGHDNSSTAPSNSTPPPPILPPTLALSSSAQTVALGQSATLTWTATRATACQAIGPWSGAQVLQGSISVTPTSAGNFDYTLSCTGTGGSISQSATLVVNPTDGSTPPDAPYVSLGIANPSISLGQNTTISWSSKNATSCQAGGAWSGAEGVFGSQVVTPSVIGAYAYTLNCSGPGGNTAHTVQLSVNDTGITRAAPVSLSVTPTTVVAGQGATLTWSAPAENACTASGDWAGPVAATGSLLVAPTAIGTHRYILNCTGANGNNSNTASLTVVNAYSLGGSVSGMSSGALTLSDGLGDTAYVSGNGPFTFPLLLADGSPYNVQVQTQPLGQTCNVANGSGMLSNGNTTNVAISCTAAKYPIGGSIAGLTGSDLVLQNNAGDDLTVTANATTFTFATPLIYNSTYTVSIKTQPAHQICVLSNATGKVAGSPVTNVSMTCASQYAYVTNSGDGTVSQFLIATDGHLMPMSPATISSGNGPASIAIDPTGQYAYAANKNDGTISQYTISAAGILSAMGTATIATNIYPTQIMTDPSGKYGYATNKGAGTVSQFTIGTRGQLTAQSPATVTAGAQPYRITLTPDTKYAYVANLQGNISQYILNNGSLSLQTKAQVSAGAWPLDIALDPKGQHAYVTNSGLCQTCADGTISQFTIDNSGNLVLMTNPTLHVGSWPAAILVTPSGKYAYVANLGDNTVSQLSVTADGHLNPLSTATLATGTSPNAITVDSQEQYVYIVNGGSNNISEYRIGSDGSLNPMTIATIAAGTNPNAIVIGKIR